LVVIATLALGIGANTAIFELLDAVRLRALPVQAPQELAELRIAGGNQGFGVTDGPYSQFTIPMWQEVRRSHDPFSGISAWRSNDVLEGRMTDMKRIHGRSWSAIPIGSRTWAGSPLRPVRQR
jgi:hypothetical protein